MLFHCGFNCIIGRADVEAEAPILWPPDAKSWLIWKDPDAGKDWGQEEKGMTEDEMVGWHHWLEGYGFGWTLGVGDGQGGLVCCSSWGCKELDTTERLNWTELSACILSSPTYQLFHLNSFIGIKGFPDSLVGKESTCIVGDLGWEDPLEKGKVPIPVFWPGEFHGLYSPWGHKELDMNEWLSLSLVSEWATRKALVIGRPCCSYCIWWLTHNDRL